MAKLCWEKLKEKGKVEKVEPRWEEERRRFLKKRDVELEKVERKRRKGIKGFGGVVKKDSEMQRGRDGRG